MKNKLPKWALLLLIVGLLFIPAVSAKLLLPLLPTLVLYGSNLFFLIPIILLEAGLAWYLAKNWYHENITMLRMSLYFLAANIPTDLLDFFWATIVPLDIAVNVWSFIPAALLRALSPIHFLIISIPHALLNALLEWPVLYFFLRKKTKNAKAVSWKLALFVNLLSGFIIVLGVSIMARLLVWGM